MNKLTKSKLIILMVLLAVLVGCIAAFGIISVNNSEVASAHISGTSRSESMGWSPNDTSQSRYTYVVNDYGSYDYTYYTEDTFSAGSYYQIGEAGSIFSDMIYQFRNISYSIDGIRYPGCFAWVSGQTWWGIGRATAIIPAYIADSSGQLYPVVEVENYCLYGDSDYYGIVLPSTVYKIGDYAFSSAFVTSLTDYYDFVYAPGVTEIGAHAFEDSSDLCAVYAPLVQTIGNYAFYGCTDLGGGQMETYSNYGSVTIAYGAPETPNCTSVGDYAFASCVGKTTTTTDGYYYIDPDGNMVYAPGGYTHTYGGFTSVSLPDVCTSVGTHAYENCTSLTSFSITGKASIGNYAFSGCSALATATMDNAKSIGQNAFEECTALTKASMSETLTIDTYAFTGCSKLETVTMSSLTSLGAYAFQNCVLLKTVTIPTTCTSIGSHVFAGCSVLATLSLPCTWSGVFGTLFSDSSFDGSCEIDQKNSSSGITAYYFPATLSSVTITGGTTIPNGAFSNCDFKIVLKDGCGITTIGCYAFYNYNFSNASRELTIPETVTSIGWNAFEGCTNLTYIYADSLEMWCNIVPSSISGWGSESETWNPLSVSGSALYVGGTGKKLQGSVEIPAGVETLQYAVFVNCTAIQSVTFEEGAQITKISACAFKNCTGLTSVVIPATVTSMGKSVFTGCYQLESLSIPFVGSSASVSSSAVSDNSKSASNCFGYIFGEDSYTNGLLTDQSGKETDNFSFYIPYALTTVTVSGDCVLAARAFCNCTTLKSIALTGNVTVIGEYAFSGCTGLTSLNLGEGVESVYGFAFQSCSALTTLTIPDSCTSLGNSIFEYCAGLTSLTLPFVNSSSGAAASVTSLFGNLFGQNSGKNVSDDEAAKWVTVTQKYSSGGSTSAYYIPAGLTAIEITGGTGNAILYGTFWGCTMFETVIIGANVTYVDDCAFRDCSGITSLEINSGKCYKIGSEAFENCSSLPEIIIPYSIEIIGDSAFSGCTAATVLTFDGAEVNGGFTWCLNEIGSKAFLMCAGISTLEVPNTVTLIGEAAFGQMWGLVSITLPFVGSGSATEACEESLFGWIFDNTLSTEESDRRNSYYAYDSDGNGTAGKTFTIPVGLESITITGGELYTGAFSGCTTKAETMVVTLPDTITKIPDYVFISCNNLSKVTIGSNVSEIGIYAFAGDAGLTQINLDEGRLSAIDDHAFYDCTGLVQISSEYNYDSSAKITSGNKLPSGLSYIGEYAFYLCRNLAQISFAGTVLTIISPYAFAECYSIKDINFGSCVETIGSNAFENCTSLSDLSFPSTLKTIGASAFYGCIAVTELNLNDGTTSGGAVTAIYDSAFRDCTSLETVTLDDNLRTLGSYAFAECESLTYVYIGSKLTSLGNYITMSSGNKSGCVTIEFDAVNSNDDITDEGGLYLSAGSETLEIVFGSDVENIPSYILSNDANNCVENVIISFAEKSASDAVITRIPVLSVQTYINNLTINIPDSISYIEPYGLPHQASLTSSDEDALNEIRSGGGGDAVLVFNINTTNSSKSEDSEGHNDIWMAILSEDNFPKKDEWGQYESSISLTAGTVLGEFVDNMNRYNNAYYSCGWYKFSFTRVVEPGCTTIGYTEYECTDNGVLLADEITASLNHLMFSSVTDPTCTEQGYTTHSCLRDGCDYSYTDTYIDALGHSKDEGTPISATCTTGGYVEYTCTRDGCGYVWYEATGEEGYGHTIDYDNPVEIVEATCMEDGYILYECSVCHSVCSTRTLYATGHTYSYETTAVTCVSDGYTTYTCNDCGYSYISDVITATGHAEYQSPALSTAATCVTDGENVWVCSVCGEVTKAEVVSATGEHTYTELNTVAATCTTNGYVIYKCSVCGKADETTRVVLPATGHVRGEEANHIDATCTADGVITYYCSVCGEIDTADTEILEALGHDWDSGAVTPATCTEQGYTTFSCLRCNETYTDDETSALGHSYITLINAATCVEDGETYDVCTRCSYINESTRTAISATGEHTYEELRIIEATCTTEGQIEYQCAVCGGTITTITDALGHDWNSGVVAKESTCTENGIMVYTCTRDGCAAQMNEKIEKTGHDYGDFVIQTIEATCGAEGCTYVVCVNCGYEMQLSTIEALEHEWSVKTTVGVSCTADGYTTYVCEYCGETYTEMDATATGHTWKITGNVLPTCTADGYLLRECSVCGEKEVTNYMATGHNYSIVTVAACTCTEDGYTTRTCAYCGDTYVNDYVYATGHTYDQTLIVGATCTEDGYTEHICSKCGETYQTDIVAATGHSYSGCKLTVCDGYLIVTCICSGCGEDLADTLQVSFMDTDGIVRALPVENGIVSLAMLSLTAGCRADVLTEDGMDLLMHEFTNDELGIVVEVPQDESEDEEEDKTPSTQIPADDAAKDIDPSDLVSVDDYENLSEEALMYEILAVVSAVAVVALIGALIGITMRSRKRK